MPRAFSETLNQGRFETWTEKPTIGFSHVTQVHGTEIASLNSLPCDADGMVVAWENFSEPMAIKTADCLPVVIEGKKGAVFLHAGWRGLADGILERNELVHIEPIRALIGPSIHACCFEVSEDFKNNFPDSEFFVRKEGKLYFDLQLEAKHRLRTQFPNLLISVAPICTCCHLDFHSYRRDKTKQRNWNLYIKG